MRGEVKMSELRKLAKEYYRLKEVYEARKQAEFNKLRQMEKELSDAPYFRIFIKEKDMDIVEFIGEPFKNYWFSQLSNSDFYKDGKDWFAKYDEGSEACFSPASTKGTKISFLDYKPDIWQKDPKYGYLGLGWYSFEKMNGLVIDKSRCHEIIVDSFSEVAIKMKGRKFLDNQYALIEYPDGITQLREYSPLLDSFSRPIEPFQNLKAS